VLLVAGRKPLEVEFGYEPFFSKGNFAQSGVVSFPVDKVDKPGIPIVVLNKPFEKIFGASHFAKVGCIVAGNSDIVDRSSMMLAGIKEQIRLGVAQLRPIEAALR
jgi:hypothetical protein